MPKPIEGAAACVCEATGAAIGAYASVLAEMAAKHDLQAAQSAAVSAALGVGARLGLSAAQWAADGSAEYGVVLWCGAAAWWEGPECGR
jgi:hypothetical protein